MSCRTTPAGSAFTSYARLVSADNGISDVAVLSTFHELRREYAEIAETRTWMTQNLDREGYLSNIATLKRQIETNSDLSDARKASLLARLEAAAAADPIPDIPTLYALSRITAITRSRARTLNTFLTEYARTTGSTMEEAIATFNELENSIDRTRGAANPDTYTETNRIAAREAGLGFEAGTVHAYTMMLEESRMASRMLVSGRPPRIIMDPIAASSNEPVGEERLIIQEAGYDPRVSRLEVTVVDAEGNQTRQAYSNISRSEYDNMINNDNPSDYWYRNFRGYRWHNYNNVEDEVRFSVAPRCSICGQFANNQHSCPTNLTSNLARYDLSTYRTRTSNQSATVTYETPEGTRTSQVRVRLPLVSEIRPTARNSSVVLDNIRDYVAAYNPETQRTTGASVTGQVAMMRDPETNEVSYNSGGLQCDCEVYRRNYHCTHVDNYMAALRTRISPPASSTLRRSMTEAERIAAAAENQRRAEAAAASDWTKNEETLEEARKTWIKESSVLYSEDFETFKQQYEAATEAMLNKGGAAVPYMKENALGGMATRESGQAFGIEIEYEFPRGIDRYAANRRIGEALKEANITSTSQQQGYHASVRNGYKDTHVDPETGLGTWSWERDGSVSGGELVSPGMYDEPETWEKLEQVVKIIKDNGGIATAKAGAHVHVGTKFFGADPKKYGELAKMMNQHEDVMFRLAQNPERGKHRQGHYTEPLPSSIPAGGWTSVSEVKNWQRSRTRIVNFYSTSDDANDSSHPEFRIFDSTLDAGVMQTQIKLAVAMTHAAARTAEQGGTSRGKEQLGSHAARNAARGTRRRMSDEELKADTATFRSFVDTLFQREEDKKQVTALFAATKWNKPDAANRRRQELENS